MSVKIKDYSDYVCPFCYLAEFPLQEANQGKDVEVEWMPFELRPEQRKKWPRLFETRALTLQTATAR